MPKQKKPPTKKPRAEVIIRARFRKATDLALKYMNNQSLDFLSFRIESELRFMAEHGGKTVSELSPGEMRKLEKLLLSKAAGVKPIDRKGRKAKST